MLGPLEEVLCDPADPARASRANVVLVERNARRLLRLVGTLLDFSPSRQGACARRSPRLIWPG
jgi:hypothetical protein